MPELPITSPIFERLKSGLVTATSPPFFDIKEHGTDKDLALADLNAKLLRQIPKLTDDEFRVQLLEIIAGLNRACPSSPF